MNTEILERAATADNIFRREASLAGDFDDAQMTVEAVASTFADVTRRDAKGVYIERLDPAGLDVASAAGVPLLDGHRQGSARDVVGITSHPRIEDGKLLVRLRLSQADDARPVVQRIREKMLRLSIGYSVSRWTESVDPTTKARVRTAAAWRIVEVSAVPVPADPGAHFRGKNMPKHILEQLEEGIETVDAMPEEQQTRIRSIGELADLPPSWAAEQIAAHATEVDARRAAREAMITRSAATPRIRVQSPAGDDPAVRIRAMEEALHVRVAGGTPTDAARQYMGHTLRDFARECVEVRGQSTRGMDADTLFRTAMHTMSDFPGLLTGVGRRTLMSAYTNAASPVKALARQGNRTDFRTGTALRLGELGALQPLSESGEIKSVTRGEAAESYALDTYAALFAISRKALINDDLGAFNDWANAAGQASAQTEAALLWNLLSMANGAGPTMSDSKALFHADHGNLLDAAALSEESLSDARLALRQQKGLDGKTFINVVPKYLVVGPALETTAEKLLTTINATNSADVNPFAGKLTLAVEPRIQDYQWFLFADPAAVPVLEYSYLSSAPGPQMASREGWETLSVEYRVHLDFGAGAVDFRGAVRNPGAVDLA